MLDFIKDKKDCCGCSGCMAVCPVNAIKMVVDKEGFVYPQADDKCIHCGACERICPMRNRVWEKQYTDLKQESFAAVTKSSEVWRRSTSGGAFSEICKAWGNDKTIFVGAAWDGLDVLHKAVVGIQSIDSLCKSKYVESHVNGCFRSIKDYLDAGRKVLFAGTPCQVAGLNIFLGKNYENLLTVDIVCHGNGSPLVFKTSIKCLEDYCHATIDRFEFRAKNAVYETDYLSKAYFDNREIWLDRDIYTQLFLKQLCLRPCCGENCHYRTQHRQGDITLADFRGLREVMPSLAYGNWNYSAVIVNTSKGRKAFNLIKENKAMDIYNVDLEVIKKYNPLFYTQTVISTDRESFFKEYFLSPNETVTKWSKGIRVHKLSYKRKIYNILPPSARYQLIGLIRKMRIMGPE
jgi:NAD-dependent dihydropyrimidine dehydrogenase PreA subunit